MGLRNVEGEYLREVSSWRKMAAVAWSAPDDPVIYGTLELDFTAGLAYIREQAARYDTHITPVHLVVRAIAEVLKRHPECNGMIRRGRIFEREHVDISVLVAVSAEEGHEQRADLSNTIVRDADQKRVDEIARMVAAGARGIREHHDPFLQNTKKMFDRMPSWLIKRVLHLAARAEYQWNLNLSRLGIPRDPFGSLLVTNVGSFGLHRAFAPIPPFSWVPAVIALGEVEQRPVVVGGEIVIRPILPINATIDHRLIDGYQGAKLAGSLRTVLEHPERLNLS